MNITLFIILMTGIAVINGINQDCGPISATHEDAKGMNGAEQPNETK